MATIKKTKKENPKYKSVDIPSWWKEGMVIYDQLENMYSKLLGLSKKEQKEERDRRMKITSINMSELDKDKMTEESVRFMQNKYSLLESTDRKVILKFMDIMTGIKEYLWDRFRAENKNNEFGKAENLQNDEITNRIYIVNHGDIHSDVGQHDKGSIGDEVKMVEVIEELMKEDKLIKISQASALALRDILKEKIEMKDSIPFLTTIFAGAILTYKKENKQ